jgi:hypothetical protein
MVSRLAASKSERKQKIPFSNFVVVDDDFQVLSRLAKAGVDIDQAFIRAVRQGNVRLVDLMLETGVVWPHKAYRNGKTLIDIGLARVMSGLLRGCGKSRDK